MCAVENLARICRSHPRSADLSRPQVLAYGTASIRLESLKNPPYFSYNTACAVVRGLAEYMTANQWWFESDVDVSVDGTLVGSALVWNPEHRIASTDTT